MNDVISTGKCLVILLTFTFIYTYINVKLFVVTQSFTPVRGRSSDNRKVRLNYPFYMCGITSFQWNLLCRHHHVPFLLSGVSVFEVLYGELQYIFFPFATLYLLTIFLLRFTTKRIIYPSVYILIWLLVPYQSKFVRSCTDKL